MKKTKLNLLLVLLSAFALAITTSCKDDENDDPVDDGTPKLDVNFFYDVNDNDVTFTTTLSGNVWFTDETSGTEYPAEGGSVVVNIPLKGDYPFTCNTLVEGAPVSSEEFFVPIEKDDLSFLETGVWNALTGGVDGNKTWVLDVREITTTVIDDAGTETTSTAYKSAYFHNPLDFYGDEEAGGADGAWGPWGGTSIYDWGGTPEDGEISFDGVERKATLVIDGVSAEASFSMQTYERDPDFLTIPAENTGGDAMSLWDYMLEKTGYSNVGKLSEQMADLTFSDTLRFPMDKGRLNNDGNVTYPNQFLEEDLKDVTLMHATDSALVVRVKRTYEGDAESKCWLLYNYIVKEYDYGVTVPNTHPVVTDLTADDLAGTWKVATIPMNWISWSTKDVMNEWATRDEIIATGWAATEESLAAADEVRLTFATDGSCTINGTETTFEINKGGYIAFADSVNIPACAITLAGKNIYGVDVASSTEGIWLGQNNGTKEETSAIHIIKE